MPKLTFSRLAEEDLSSIAEYIARDSKEAARRFVSFLETKCLLLSESPLIGRSRNDIRHGIRTFPVKTYIIIYRPIDDGVEIVRVLHSAMDIEAIFSEE